MHLLKPAVQLINRLRYPRKFVLIVMLLAIPLLVIAGLFLLQISRNIEFTARERLGLTYIAPLIDLIEAVQHHAIENSPAQEALGLAGEQINDEVSRAIDSVNAVDGELGEILGVSLDWQAAREEVESLMLAEGQYSSAETLLLHVALTEQLRNLIVQVGNESNLVLDPDIDTYYLMDTIINKLPTSMAYLSQMQNYSVIASAAPSLSDLERLTLLRQFIQTTEDSMRNGLGYAFEKNPGLGETLLPVLEERQTSIRGLFVPLEGAQLSGGRSRWQQWISSGEFGIQAGDVLTRTYGFFRLTSVSLNDLLAIREGQIIQTRNGVIVLTVIAFLMAGYLFAALYVSIQNTIHALDHTTQRLIEGQPEEKLVLENRDELAQIATSFNNIGRELINARDKAVQASRVKDEFLATMSHELRTPLNSIIGYTDILMLGMRGQVDDEAKELLQFVSDSSFRLLTLINDLLDIAKIEAGRFEISTELFQTRPLIDSWATEAGGLASNRNLSFAVHIDEALPLDLYGDQARITQIAMNLLSNAVKFTETGGIKLDITADKSAWRIEVTDSGIGIPAHALEYIFDEFRQVDGTYQRAYGGTGLGLAISRKLAMMMGGRIQVKSKVGEGSTFTVTLPLRMSAVMNSEGKETLYAS